MRTTPSTTPAQTGRNTHDWRLDDPSDRVALVCTTESKKVTALVADIEHKASDPADLRPMVTGKRPLVLTPDRTRTDLPCTHYPRHEGGCA